MSYHIDESGVNTSECQRELQLEAAEGQATFRSPILTSERCYLEGVSAACIPLSVGESPLSVRVACRHNIVMRGLAINVCKSAGPCWLVSNSSLYCQHFDLSRGKKHQSHCIWSPDMLYATSLSRFVPDRYNLCCSQNITLLVYRVHMQETIILSTEPPMYCLRITLMPVICRYVGTMHLRLLRISRHCAIQAHAC